MIRVEEYLNSHAASLRQDFERVRAAVRDSAVKGTANEEIVGTFLREHLNRRVAYNSTVIDARGGESDEVDLAICNDDQPFVTGDRAQLLLVEGVDFVVQVKARLTTSEIGRIIKNASTVKRLIRSAQIGDLTFAKDEDLPFFVHRVAYITFCFESELTADTATRTLRGACEEVPWEEQPDAVFILDRASIGNVRDNTGLIRANPPECRGFILFDGGDRVLLEMMRVISYLPRIRRVASPLTAYLGG